MKYSILSFLKHYLFWICYFLFFKALFFLGNFQITFVLPWSDIFGIFWHGLQMDLSMAAYLSVLPGIVIALDSLIKTPVLQKVLQIYTLTLLIITTLAGLVDIALYPAWGTRLNAQILPYLSDPGGIFSSVSIGQLLLFVLFEILIVFVWYFLFKRLFRSKKTFVKSKWHTSLIMLVLTAVLIIPIRGLGFAPLNFSSVYFSTNLASNHAAYNYLWSFFYSITHRIDKNREVYMSNEECETQMNGIDLLTTKSSPVYIKSKNGKPINVVLVILESFSNKVIEPLGGLPDITPRLNQFCTEGISFSSFYAVGDRSDKGISALLTSYPALLEGSSIARFPEKMNNLDYLGRYFEEHAYDRSFYYGGDINFYNTRILLMQSGIEKIVSISDFAPNISAQQRWGTPDQYLFERAANELSSNEKPFFSIIYTISSHEPFDVPFQRIKGNRNVDKYLNSIAYTDNYLGVFIDRMKESSSWENTLVIITSDHAILEPGPTSFEELDSYKIPFVWIGGVIDTTFVCNNIGSQTDLSATLAYQLGWKHKPSFFSKNSFADAGYAFYCRGEGWGFVSPDIAFFVNLQSENRQFFYGEDSPKSDSLVRFSEAFRQFLRKDFDSR